MFPLGPHHTSPPKFKVSSWRSTTWILNQRSHFSHTTKLKGRNKRGNTDLVQETKKISTYNIALIESKLYSNANETGNQKDKRKQTRTHGKMLLVAHFSRMEPNTLVHLLYVNKWQEEEVLQWREHWRQRVFIAWKRNTTSEYAYLSLVRILYVVWTPATY